MNLLILERRGRPIAEFPIGGRPLEVGRHPSCDIVVDDGEAAERELLLRDRGDTVVAYDLREGRRGRHFILRPGEPRSVGSEHAIMRVCDAPSADARLGPTTERLSIEPLASRVATLTVGRGPEARRVRIDGRPIGIGTDEENTIVLTDRAVSALHCRLDPTEGGALIRDLDSRNGTWVRGVRVERACLMPGESFRIGRTDLHLTRHDLDEKRADPASPEIVAVSSAMREVMRDLQSFERLDWPVLIEGESGVGKELVAQALHRRSRRPGGPFVAINAGGLPRELVESELFGHERGAFTGAHAAHRGVFEQADGGTLFLDEIGELPLDLQARLLRVLETWEVRRVGAESSVRVDVRLVSATHRDLPQMVGEGTFRRDLLYRLRRLVLRVPPLRERSDDIGPLARRFLLDIAAEVGPRELSLEAEARLLSHRWPGNIRELRNVVSAAAAASPGRRIEGEDMLASLARVSGAEQAAQAGVNLLDVLERHGGNRAAAARALGLPRTTFRDRLVRELSG